MINEIDPRIYNFKNLKLEDQVVVASQFKIFLLVKKEKEDLKETADKQNSLTKFLYEVAIEELDEVEEKIKVTSSNSQKTKSYITRSCRLFEYWC